MTPLVTTPATPSRRRPQAIGQAAPRWCRAAAVALLFVAAGAAAVHLGRGGGGLGRRCALIGAVPVSVSAAGATATSGAVPTITPAATRVPPSPELDDTPSLPTPLLTNLELLTLQTHVRGAIVYVEWGSGASTSLVAPLAARAFSVDNNREWCDRVAARPDVAWWRALGVLTVECVDTGPTVAFGAPAPGADPDLFPAYSRAIDAIADALNHKQDDDGAAPVSANASGATHTHPIDAVFVDGRFRVACALRALPHVAPGRGAVMVHDWDRAHYGAALVRFYDVVEVAGRLAVLTPKQWQQQQQKEGGGGGDAWWAAWREAVAQHERDPA